MAAITQNEVVNESSGCGAGEHAQIEAALLDAVPGLEVLDHQLVLDGLCADAVGVDAEGRLNLVLFIDGQAESLPMQVLDVLRLARRQRLLLARHLDEARLDFEAEACVIVVASGFDALVAERLACLPKHQVRCFQVHEMRSEKGLSTLLLPAFPDARDQEWQPTAPDDFLSNLSDSMREMVTDLTARIERIDREVALASGPGGLEWRYRGTPLCRLRGDGDGLVGSVIEGPSFTLSKGGAGGGRDLEGFLDASMRRFLNLMDTLGQLEAASLGPRPELSFES